METKSLEIFFKMASCSGVMLGIPDEKISFEDDISNPWTTNKFGGVPVSQIIIFGVICLQCCIKYTQK